MSCRSASWTTLSISIRLNGIGSDGLGGGDTDGVGETEDYWVPRIGFKAGIGDSVDCLADYSQPWGAHTKPGADWAGANDNIETKIKATTTRRPVPTRFDVGKGQFRIIGGGFYQEVGWLQGAFRRTCSTIWHRRSGTGVGRLDLEGSAVGWRIGAAYEIPEFALRASLVYNSQSTWTS